MSTTRSFEVGLSGSAITVVERQCPSAREVSGHPHGRREHEARAGREPGTHGELERRVGGERRAPVDNHRGIDRGRAAVGKQRFRDGRGKNHCIADRGAGMAHDRGRDPRRCR